MPRLDLVEPGELGQVTPTRAGTGGQAVGRGVAKLSETAELAGKLSQAHSDSENDLAVQKYKAAARAKMKEIRKNPNIGERNEQWETARGELQEQFRPQSLFVNAEDFDRGIEVFDLDSTENFKVGNLEDTLSQARESTHGAIRVWKDNAWDQEDVEFEESLNDLDEMLAKRVEDGVFSEEDVEIIKNDALIAVGKKREQWIEDNAVDGISSGLFSDPTLDQAERLKRAGKIEDRNIRNRVINDLNVRHAQETTRERLEEAEVYDQNLATILQDPTASIVDPGGKLTPKKRDQLERVKLSTARKEYNEPDFELVAELTDLKAQDPEAFKNFDLEERAADLGGMYAQMRADQKRMLSGAFDPSKAKLDSKIQNLYKSWLKDDDITGPEQAELLLNLSQAHKRMVKDLGRELTGDEQRTLVETNRFLAKDPWGPIGEKRIDEFTRQDMNEFMAAPDPGIVEGHMASNTPPQAFREHYLNLPPEMQELQRRRYAIDLLWEAGRISLEEREMQIEGLAPDAVVEE